MKKLTVVYDDPPQEENEEPKGPILPPQK